MDFTVITTSHPNQALSQVANMFALVHSQQGERFAENLVLGLGPSADAFSAFRKAVSPAVGAA